MGVVLTIGKVGVKVGVGSLGAGVFVGAGVAAEVSCSLDEISEVGAIPPPIEATASGVSVANSSPPGAIKVGAEADLGEREHAKLTPASRIPNKVIFFNRWVRI